jgi:hypothetical protein
MVSNLVTMKQNVHGGLFAKDVVLPNVDIVEAINTPSPDFAMSGLKSANKTSVQYLLCQRCLTLREK